MQLSMTKSYLQANNEFVNYTPFVYGRMGAQQNFLKKYENFFGF